VEQCNAGAELKIRCFRMKKLFGQRSIGPLSQAEEARRLMSCHHGRALEEVLEDQVLLTAQRARAL
jgi:hypothetical protein